MLMYCINQPRTWRALRFDWRQMPIASCVYVSTSVSCSCSIYPPRHWHRVAEWGYILGGTGRLTAIDENGKNFISDIKGPSNGTDPDIY